MLESVLVANRGEIARRVIATTRRLGIRSVAVYSEADADLPFVREADEAVLIGPPPPAQSYLDAGAILAAARQSAAAAVHPGYGFLSENAAFAQQVQAEGLTWVGPTPEAIEQMGDKINARNLMHRAGIPVALGSTEPVTGPGAARNGLRWKYRLGVTIGITWLRFVQTKRWPQSSKVRPNWPKPVTASARSWTRSKRKSWPLMSIACDGAFAAFLIFPPRWPLAT